MNPVIIEEYDARWPGEFQIIRGRVAAVLKEKAAAIEHIGSTAVPGLAAKPIIDIDVLLKSKGDLPLAIAALATIGYTHRGDLGITGREAFRAPRDTFAHHLYVCPSEEGEFRRHIAFRDCLRTHPHAASEYAKLKRELASRFASDREAYNNAKSAFVGKLLVRAAAENRARFRSWRMRNKIAGFD